MDANYIVRRPASARWSQGICGRSSVFVGRVRWSSADTSTYRLSVPSR